MSMLFSRLLGRARQADPAALEAFVARQSAFVTQKTVLDYCRVKTGRAEREAFANPDFAAALLHCRWQTFAGAALDVTAMAEAWLRPHAPGREAMLAEALAAIGGAVLDAAPAPEPERETLEAAKQGLLHHLMVLQDAPPLSADRLPLRCEAPLLATIPFHPDQRIGETPSIRGALRFHFVATQQELERAFDAPAVTARLVQG
ncbi:hypothetical protein [Falsiroseomonas sp.]|uniref:hypothetical protein n=1 Tax=Falsiroseomonas sp. TaxID=2870721 RepID=UPI00356A046F